MSKLESKIVSVEKRLDDLEETMEILEQEDYSERLKED
jgi:hypothetical protein